MNTPRTVEPGFRSRKVSEGQTWNRVLASTRNFRSQISDSIFWNLRFAICNSRRAWLRYGRFVPRLRGNSYCGVWVEWRFALALWIFFGLTGLGYAHSGIVDGYGCHRGTDKVSYHCHQGEFIGRTFKSKEDFLRQLRSGKSEQLSPKSNVPRLEKKIDE
jgi:hypothetical protein